MKVMLQDELDGSDSARIFCRVIPHLEFKNLSSVPGTPIEKMERARDF